MTHSPLNTDHPAAQGNDESLSLLLASSIHEVKNNFGKLVFAITDALDELPDEKATKLQDKVNSEIRYISNQLSQVLILYKEYQDGYMPVIEEVQVSQLFKETRARHQSFPDLQVSTECEMDLLAFMDDKFIVNVLDTLIYNAYNAGARQILISAVQETDAVKITVEDNGPGIPEEMIQNFNREEGMSEGLTESGFGLGLFFARKILALHTNESLQGSCTLANGGRLGGAIISLYFP